MTDRKFTPPTKPEDFPAEYVDGNDTKVIIYAKGHHGLWSLIGQDLHGVALSYNERGVYEGGGDVYDLHDIPKRITTWHNVCANWVGPQYSSRSDADETDRELRAMKRLCVYRIERDEDGGNPEIFVEEV